jgi:hypothetical protein
MPKKEKELVFVLDDDEDIDEVPLNVGIIGRGSLGSALSIHVDSSISLLQCGHDIPPELSKCQVIILAVPAIAVPNLLPNLPKAALIIDAVQPHKRSWKNINAFFNVSSDMLRSGNTGTILVFEPENNEHKWKILKRIFPDLSFGRLTESDHKEFIRRLEHPFQDAYMCFLIWLILFLLVWGWASWSRNHYFFSELSDMASGAINCALGFVAIIFCSLPFIPGN